MIILSEFQYKEFISDINQRYSDLINPVLVEMYFTYSSKAEQKDSVEKFTNSLFNKLDHYGKRYNTFPKGDVAYVNYQHNGSDMAVMFLMLSCGNIGAVSEIDAQGNTLLSLAHDTWEEIDKDGALTIVSYRSALENRTPPVEGDITSNLWGEYSELDHLFSRNKTILRRLSEKAKAPLNILHYENKKYIGVDLLTVA